MVDQLIDIILNDRQSGHPGGSRSKVHALLATLFSGATGEALALKRAGAAGVKVFAFEGEGGLTTGATHEVLNSAWGLALDNLNLVVDWNNYGIDEHPVDGSTPGSPGELFASHGWRVYGAEQDAARNEGSD